MIQNFIYEINPEGTIRFAITLEVGSLIRTINVESEVFWEFRGQYDKLKTRLEKTETGMRMVAEV